MAVLCGHGKTGRAVCVALATRLFVHLGRQPNPPYR